VTDGTTLESIDRAFWDEVVRRDFEVPAGHDLSDLAVELVHLLGSPDPYDRDKLALPTLATWVHRGVFDDLLPGLGDGMCDQLQVGLGERNTDSLFGRTFAVLVVAAVVERDNEAHLLHPDAVRRWTDRVLAWWVAERDLRGHVPGKGWGNAVGHGADFVVAVARSRHLRGEELSVLLDAVGDRLAATSRHLVNGEEDRLAYAAMTVLHREQVPADLLADWLAQLSKLAERGHTDPARANTVRFLRALFVQLAAGVRPMPWHADPQHYAERPRTRDVLLGEVLGALRSFDPGYLARAVEGETW
jgi:Protein of unknown function (DUF2785)